MGLMVGQTLPGGIRQISHGNWPLSQALVDTDGFTT